MAKFNRSEFMRERHALAKQQRDFFQDEFGETPKYSDFLKSDTPLTSKIVTYEVSFQLSYRGETDHLNISPKTFKVTTFQGNESEIYSRTMSMILDSKGVNTGHHFHPNTIEKAIEPNLNISIAPRGMEESQRRPTASEIKGVINSRFEVSNLDTTLGFKNKRNHKGEMKLDVRHFL